MDDLHANESILLASYIGKAMKWPAEYKDVNMMSGYVIFENEIDFSSKENGKAERFVGVDISRDNTLSSYSDIDGIMKFNLESGQSVAFRKEPKYANHVMWKDFTIIFTTMAPFQLWKGDTEVLYPLSYPDRYLLKTVSMGYKTPCKLASVHNGLLYYVCQHDSSLVRISINDLLSSDSTGEVAKFVNIASNVVDFTISSRKVIYCTENSVNILYSRQTYRPSWTTDYSDRHTRHARLEGDCLVVSAVAVAKYWIIAASLNAGINSDGVKQYYVKAHLYDVRLRETDNCVIPREFGLFKTPCKSLTPIHKIRTIPRLRASIVIMLGLYSRLSLLAVARGRMTVLQELYKTKNEYINGLAVDKDMNIYVSGIGHISKIRLSCGIKL